MAEITKITTPIMPKENTSIKFKPVSDQAFQLTDPSKVHKSDNEGKVSDRQPDASTLLKDSMGRPAVATLLRNPADLMQSFKKIALLIEMGVSASDAAKDAGTRELLESLFASPKQVAGLVAEQDKSSVLFKGEVFDILRDIMSKFEDNPKVRDAVVNLLKTFDQNVSVQTSLKTILFNCNTLLDYMFSKDKSQFSGYIRDLAQMLLPKAEAEAFIAKMADPAPTGQAQANPDAPQSTGQQAGQQTVAQGNLPEQAQNAQNADGKQAVGQNGQPAQADGAKQAQNPQQTQQTQDSQTPQQAQNQQKAGEQVNDPLNRGLNTQKFGNELYQAAKQAAMSDEQTPQLSQKETAGILKNNLLPLLSEIVVKYNQSDKIRDIVMVVVHNIVRVDKGTPEALKDAVSRLINELKDIANVPKNFEKQLLEAVNQSANDAKNTPNSVISKLSDIVSEALRSPDTNPAVFRQAESMLISMLQNQSSMMDILHFIIPFKTPMGQVFTEFYVDPETEERVGKEKGESHKIFLSVESELHGSFELCFLETAEHVDFNIWAPEELVQSLSGLKKNFANIMQLHGYTMNSFNVDEMKAPHTVAEVFPRLVEKKVGIDLNA